MNNDYDNAQDDKQALLDACLEIDSISGECPVQAEGTLRGCEWYFKARGNRVRMDIQTEPGGREWRTKTKLYGDGPYDAGWMTHDEAEKIIREFAADFLGIQRKGAQ